MSLYFLYILRLSNSLKFNLTDNPQFITQSWELYKMVFAKFDYCLPKKKFTMCYLFFWVNTMCHYLKKKTLKLQKASINEDISFLKRNLDKTLHPKINIWPVSFFGNLSPISINSLFPIPTQIITKHLLILKILWWLHSPSIHYSPIIPQIITKKKFLNYHNI